MCRFVKNRSNGVKHTPSLYYKDFTTSDWLHTAYIGQYVRSLSEI